jgi:hypothetical protein
MASLTRYQQLTYHSLTLVCGLAHFGCVLPRSQETTTTREGSRIRTHSSEFRTLDLEATAER